MNKMRFITLFLSAALALSACAALPVTVVPPQPPLATPLPPSATLPPIITPLPADGDPQPRYILAARQALAAKLNLKLEDIVVISTAQVDWPNSCLGLPGKDEMCAEVITSGYRVMLRASNQIYEVRTAGSAPTVRIAPQSTGGGVTTTPVAEKARQDLAQRLLVAPETITVIEVEAKEWPDSCLGVSKPDVMCLQVITPGYQVNLEQAGKVYIYHTNRTGSVVVLASSEGGNGPAPAEPILSWQSAGSDCQSALISPNTISFGPCSMARVNLRWDNPEHQADYRHFVETFRSFSAQTKAGTLQFTGSGSRTATAYEQRAIAEWAEMAVAAASGGKGGAQYGLALSWHREGGFAGFCDDLLIYRSGAALASSCKGNSARKLGAAYLTSAQLDQLYAWLDDLKTFSYKYSDPATADAMRLQLLLNGTGNKDVSDSARQAILNLSQDVFASLSGVK